jgi:hypothetical protein
LRDGVRWSVKRGDLVRCDGACYDAPINHHEAGLAIRHYVGFITERSLGVILAEDVVYYGYDQPRAWYQVLTGGRAVWVNGSGVRAV